jgi:hypothetical protein
VLPRAVKIAPQVKANSLRLPWSKLRLESLQRFFCKLWRDLVLSHDMRAKALPVLRGKHLLESGSQ